MEKAEDAKTKRSWMIGCIVILVAILMVFKYYGFFAEQKARKKMHISLSDSYFDTNEYTLVYNKYNDLNYPFRNGIALVAPPIINGIGIVNYKDYEIASYMQIPTAIHYMGTLESNPSDGNYRKRYRKIQHTYLSSIYNLDKKNFNIIDEYY